MFRSTTLLAAVALVAACSDSSSGPSSEPQLNFSVATTSSPEAFTDGTNALVVDQVDLVLREIELRTSSATTSCRSESHHGCESLELGPILVSLPLGIDSARRAFSVTVPAGTYSGAEMEIHKPSTSDDAAFVQANPAFDGVSVHVSGSYNGAPFDFVSDLEAEQEIHFSTPLVVAEGAATDLTLSVDLNGWFRTTGGALIDPASAARGEINENVVKDNIRSALDAFEDHDSNGIDDHGGEHHGEVGDSNGQHGGVDDGPNHT